MKYFIFFLIGFLSFSNASSQVVNDDCVNAISLTPALVCNPTNGTNAGVVSTNFDNCAEIDKRNVWYKFTATSGNHIVEVSFGTMQLGIINAFSNGCGTLTPLNCGGFGQAGPIIQQTLNGLIIGQEYLVTVSTRDQTEEGTFSICILTPSAPANDECTAAIDLAVNTSNLPIFKTIGTSVFATQSQIACIGTADDDVWYSFIATQSVHRIHLSNTIRSFSVQAFSGSCASLVSIACTTPSGTTKTLPLAGLIAGQRYFIRIYSEGSAFTDQGNFELAVTSSPSNDDCSGAITVIPSPTGNGLCTSLTAGSTFEATQSSLDCFGGTSTSNDTWFQFTATQAVHRINLIRFGNPSLRFQVLTGTCAAQANIFCTSPFTIGDTAVFTLGSLITGQNYFIRVFSGGVQGLFNLCITSPVFPSNDDCVNATTLIPSSDSTLTTTAGTTKGATVFAVTGGCAPAIANDVWYRFTATSQQHVVKLKNLTNTTSISLEWWSGTCGTLVHQRCSSGGSDSLFGMGNLVIGTTYLIRVYTTSIFVRDDFTIGIFTPNALPNDECSNAISIVPTADATCDETSGSNLGATQSINDNCDGNATTGNIKDVWYKFTATNASHRIRLIRGTGQSLRFKLYSGNCAGLVAISCSVQNTATTIGAGIEQRFDGLTVGTTYLVRVFNNGTEVAGTFDLCVKTVVVPSNNECATPVVLTPQSSMIYGTYTFGSTTDATQSAQATNCSTGQDDDVWFQFTASQPAMQVMLQNGTIGATRIVVYSGTCGSLTLVKCQLGNTRDNLVALPGLTVGTVYLVRVYSSAISSGQGSFSIIATTQIAIPVNDDCGNAIELVPSLGNNCVGISGTTVDATPSGNSACVNGNEVWYRFVATATSHRVSIEGFVNTPFVTIFSGSCGALVQLPSVCAAGFSYVSVSASGLSVGNTYLIKVLNNTTAAFEQSIFSICITTPQVPVNNDCSGAISLPVVEDNSNTSSELFTTNLATFTGPFNCPVNANDVWFKFTAPIEPVTIEVKNLTIEPVIQLLTGGCGSLISISCNGTSASNLNNIINTSALIPGNNYFIRVSGSDAINVLDFRVKVYRNRPLQSNAVLDTVCLRANLVQNPGFETFFFPQTSFIGAADPGSQFITGWKLPTRGTADFFNAQNNMASSVEVPANLCFGNQSARNGYGYAGIFAYTSSSSNYREYLENQLSAPLVPGKKYLVSLNVSLSEFSTVAIDNLGIALRTTQTKELTFSNLAITPLVVSPDNQFLADKNNWVNISGIVTADQPYQYLLIGNFKNNASTDTLRVIDTSGILSGGTFSGCASTTQGAYYFIDDVVVSEVNESVSAICRLSSVPLTLLSFTAKKQQGKSMLQWKTTNEQKTSHFEIQRSKDGGLFTSIGSVNALNRYGEHNYSFADERPLPGINFYRLKQLDIDGRYEFSRVVSLQFEDVVQIKTFPNPVSDHVTILLPASMTGANLTIMAADGKIVHRALVTTLEQKINCGLWANGVYMVQIRKDQKIVIQKLVKQ